MNPLSATRPRLYLNHAVELERFIALEYGRVEDGQLEENWREVAGGFWWYHEVPEGPCLGFAVKELADFNPEAPEVEEIWSGPRFDAPLLGLTDSSAGEIAVAAKTFFDEVPSINRLYFNAAAGEEGRTALQLWRQCLEAGDSMAHFGLGYTLFELDRFHEAYRHLRHYTEISPAHPWNWVWFAKAAAAIGEIEEAIRAYERAIDLTEAGHEKTDAPELLAALRADTRRQESDPAADSPTKEEPNAHRDS
ncbi:MAG: hypothetical protein ACR2OC_08470 [Solirubrobacterales bacterium]